MNLIAQKLAEFSEWIWGWPLVGTILLAGILLTFFYRGKYLLHPIFHFKNTYFQIFQKDNKGKGTISGFAAACTALANTIGIGNIGGVASAVASGGPGAVFWLWVADIFGTSLKASEIILAQRYRVKFNKSIDEYVSDRSFVMKNSMGWKKGGYIVAFFVIIFGPWTNVVQSESIQSSIRQAADISSVIILGILGLSVFFTIYKGIRRISELLERVVPVMAIFYVLFGIIIMVVNADKILPSFQSIFIYAFNPAAAKGGFIGATVKESIRYGIARGIYSSDAGTGYGMVVHAPAITDHPVRQSSWGWGEIIGDLVICTVTALIVIVTDSYIKFGEAYSAELTTLAFGEVFGNFGIVLMAIIISVFGWTTIVGMYYSLSKSVNYIFGDTKFNKIATNLYIIYFLAPIVFFSNIKADLLWSITDLISGMYVVLTLVLIVGNLKEIKRLFTDFWYRYLPTLNRGENPPIVSYGVLEERNEEKY